MKNLVGSRIQKVRSFDNTFSLELYKERSKIFLVFSNKTIFISDENYGSKTNDFCMLLRKRLTNQVIQEIEQHEFDRIVEIKTNEYFLIIELFGNGNIILLDEDRKIISALEMRSWKDRIIRPKREYRYPPSSVNPFKLSLSQLRKLFGRKEVVKVLAKDLGFGGEVAEKICKKLGIDKKSKVMDTSKLFNFLQNIEREFKELENINEKLRKNFEESLVERKELKKIKERFEKIREKQLKKLREFTDKEIMYRSFAKTIHREYPEFERLMKAKPRKPRIIIKDIPIDTRKSLMENANIYFQKAKKMKKKLEGLQQAMRKLEKEKLVKVKQEKKVEVKKPREWYEKFRWFMSSDGFLVVAGKDARSNERLIRKHMKPNDLVFHTDITGSPFVLIKNLENKDVPETTIKETAQFCASYSKAWKVGLSAADVYYVKPDQVKKEGGLPTGSFMIHGKREWVRRIELKVAIGIIDSRVIYGPESVVSSKTKDYIIVRPGNENVYSELKKIFGVLAEEVKKAIPYGRCRIEK